MPRPIITELVATDARCDCLAAPADASGAIEQIPEHLRRRDPLPLPALDEATLRAHFAGLAAIGCTPWPGAALAARAARLPGLACTHPAQPAPTTQAVLEIFHEVARALAAITGLDRFSLQPPTLAAAGRAALLVARAFFERTQPARTEVVAPEGHPALGFAADLGLPARPVARLESSDIDLESLDEATGPSTLAVVASWLTPSGAFERNLAAAGQVAHARGALFCVDATGLAALAGRTRLREAEADVAWLGLRELCPVASSAALGVRSALTECLPSPLVSKQRGGYEADDELPATIGPLALAPGLLADALAAHIVLRTLGEAGLRCRAEELVVRANALARERGDRYPPGSRRVLLTI